MKRLLLIAAGLLLMINVQAQEEKKSPTMWVGGEITYGTLSALDYTIGPSWGMNFGENLAGGISATYSADDTENRWSLEPYVRYYLPVVDKFSFYGDGYIDIFGGDRDTTDDTKGDYSGTSFGAKIGLQYWFTPNWSLAASTKVLEYDTDASEFGLGASFNTVNFSFFYHF